MVAVKLTNQSAQKVVLDPRQLQGQFVSATFQHQWLDAKGTPEDTTTVYLVMKGKPDKAFSCGAACPEDGRESPMKVKSNTLVKILVPSALALAVLIGIKSCQPDTPVTGSGQDNLSQSINDLDPGELKSLGIEGDTPADTLRTLIGTMKTVRDRQAELIAQNEKLLEENAQLRNRQQNVSGQIQSAVASVRQEAESQQRALQQEQQTLMRRLDSTGGNADSIRWSAGSGQRTRRYSAGTGAGYRGQRTDGERRVAVG